MMDPITYANTYCTLLPNVTVDKRTFDSRYAMPHVPHLSTVGSPRSRDRHIVGLPIDIQR